MKPGFSLALSKPHFAEDCFHLTMTMLDNAIPTLTAVGSPWSHKEKQWKGMEIFAFVHIKRKKQLR